MQSPRLDDVPSFVRDADKLDRTAYNQAARAQMTLDAVLGGETLEALAKRKQQQVAIEEGRAGTRIVTQQSDRLASRVLFVTTDVAYLLETSKEVGLLKSLANLFDEIHVIVLTPLNGKEDSKRYAANVWVYRACATFWWQLPWAGKRRAYEQLYFASGFRPDVIVSLDPFESGLASYLIGRAFDRPVQIHVRQDFFTPKFLTAYRGNRWRRWIARFVIARAQSVRTVTSQLEDHCRTMFPRVRDLRLLPRFHNIGLIGRTAPTVNIHDLYTDYSFICLTFADLRADSTLHHVITALHTTLQNPKIALVVIGHGPAEALFREKVKLLGINRNVIFIRELTDDVSYLKTADMLIEARTTTESEEDVLRAAMAGLPMVLYETDLRNDLFVDGESAAVCPVGDIEGIERNFKSILNNSALRKQYSSAAKHVVSTRLDENESTYLIAYRDTIELALVGEAKTSLTELDPSQSTAVPTTADHMTTPKASSV